MKKVVQIIQGPALPESSGIARVVVLEDGWGQIQTYSPQKRAWVEGGSSIQSLLTAQSITREMLQDMNYDKEDIENILWRPEGQEAE